MRTVKEVLVGRFSSEGREARKYKAQIVNSASITNGFDVNLDHPDAKFQKLDTDVYPHDTIEGVRRSTGGRRLASIAGWGVAAATTIFAAENVNHQMSSGNTTALKYEAIGAGLVGGALGVVKLPDQIRKWTAAHKAAKATIEGGRKINKNKAKIDAKDAEIQDIVNLNPAAARVAANMKAGEESS